MSERKPLSAAEQALSDAALDYHRAPTRGKISVTPTKPLMNQRDLSLAYSPGVAYACLAIQDNPGLAAEFTSRANLVGVITNGTAVLGLGNIGALAGKPVMEGKGCLFKKFAGIDVFDIELAEHDPDKLVDIIAALEPTLGGINLEDIKAPECFTIERRLRERLKIPVFHDDQHGTAIISAAALLNGLEIVGKKLAGREGRGVRRGRGGDRLPRPDAGTRRAPRERVRVRLPRRAARPAQRHARCVEAALRAGHAGAHAGGRHARRRRVPRLLGRRRAHAGHGEDDGVAADHPGARQSGAGDPARAGPRGAAGLPHRHRPLGLSEPGQQRAVFPVHLPRRARLRRDEDLRSDEGRVRARDRGPRQGRDQRRSGLRLSRVARCASAPTTSSRRRSIRG